MLIFRFKIVRIVPLLMMINKMYGKHISFKRRWKVEFF